MKSTTPLLRSGLAFILLAGSGCVSAKYKSAAHDTPPPVALNLTSAPAQSTRANLPSGEPSPTTPPAAAEVIVHSVIGFHGAGSWKRDAYWDEYVISVVNRGPDLLVVDSATVTDFRGDANLPGTDPWLLEKQSLSRREELNRTAKSVLVQLGSGYLMLGVSGTLAFTAASTAAGVAGLAVFPAYIVGAVVRNVSNRHDIETEFARRRLALPAIVTPGDRKQGSLFVRIAPGPQQLTLNCRIGHEPHTLVVDLAPLRGLHLATSSATPAPPSAPSSQP